MNYCSHCGSDRLELKIPEGDSRVRHVCANCDTVHYSNPRIITGCLVTHEDKILICKRAIEPRYGLWNLPSGFLENGETVEDGAKRETLEEACAKVEIVKLHTVFSIPHVNQIYLHFLAKFSEPGFESGPESLDTQLFSPEDIPWDEMAFSSSVFAIKKYLENKDLNSSEVYLGMHKPKS